MESLQTADRMGREINAGKNFQAPRQLGMQSIWFRNGDGLYSKKQVNYEGIAIDDLSVVKDMLLKYTNLEEK